MGKNLSFRPAAVMWRRFEKSSLIWCELREGVVREKAAKVSEKGLKQSS